MRYRCHECETTYYPLDEELELSKESRMSLQKEKQLALLAVHMPYEETEKVYGELTQLKTSRMTAHRAAQRLAPAAEKAPAVVATAINRNGETRRHVTADGVMVRIREEGWKEAKVGSVYEVDSERKACDIRYTATLADRDTFGRQLYRLAGEPEAAMTRRMTFISDAARWLDELRDLAFPLAVRIVDFWHVTEYLWKVANAFYEEGSAKAKAWSHEKIGLLSRGQTGLIEAALVHMKARTKLQKEVLKATQTYFKNHAHPMDYPRYKRMGLHIGSGIAEAACKFVIQTRFKRCGMRWSRQGAENLLRLRQTYLNHQWDSMPEAAKN